MSKIIVIMLVASMLLLTTIPAVAEEIVIKSVDPSPYYDSKPCIYGNYIVWRRAINQNNNEFIELREPSWIMVHDIRDSKTWNITAENKLMGNPDIYYHAESPEIYGDKIIYEAQGSGNSWDTRLYMYNISSKDTWEIPLKSTSYAHGHHHLIDSNWIAYTHKESCKRQAYLLNYEDGSYRTIVNKSENYSVYGLVMWDNNIVINVLNNSGGHEILLYDIDSASRKTIHIDGNYSKAIATTIYGGRVGISILETVNNITQWNAYIYDIYTGHLELFKNGAYGLLIWNTQIAYVEGGNIYLTELGEETIIISSVRRQYLGDIYNNEIVWMDNSNSEANYGDARDDWDVFMRKQVTTQEIAHDIISDNWIVILIIITVIVIGYLARRNGKEGMI
ncbi:hypothetical protein KAU43_05880 [candidate division WOR-3 bacterium]|nr:hypothetical protein [candidate division WOR-3 bacterium]